jgi:hypothetical protein
VRGQLRRRRRSARSQALAPSLLPAQTQKYLVVAVAAACLASLVRAAMQASPAGPILVQKMMIDSPLDDIQWADSETVFVLTENGNLYRSADGGKGWTNQMSKLGSSAAQPAIRSVHVSAVNPNNVFLMGTASENWISFDMGKTYKAGQQLNLHEVRLHPRQPKWLLGASMSSGCSGGGGGDKNACYKIMHVSKDFGISWTQSVTYVVQFDWAPYGNSTSKSKVTPKHADVTATEYKDPEAVKDDDLVYATIHEVKKGSQKFGMWDKNIHMYHSFDYFKTSVRTVRHGNRFLFGEHDYLFVAAVNPHQETEVSLQITRDAGSDKKFKTALLPVELTEHSYTILDTSEGTVFLHVNHQPFDLNAPTGHVYISDWSGTQYSLSLPYNHRSGDGKCDFEKVEGLEGIYLANFVDETEDDKVETWDESSAAGHKPAGHKRIKTKTVITFDKGGIWSYLEPPEVDSSGRKVQCSPGKDCHLHLHGITDLYGPFYSSSTATGLIMATGTVGSFLQENVDKINTYLSRDAGLTWYEVAKGSHIYEFGDHGALIVMAYDEGETDSVLYSWDQGVTWKSLKISETPLQVENIIIEPEAISQRFVVYGWQEDSGVLIYIDFTELHERACVGHDAPDSSASDYETWTPSDGRVGRCLLGHRVTYTRRKRTSQCFVPEEYERGVFQSHCECTAEDFECDYGYFRRIESGECVRQPEVELPPVVPPDCKGSYFITKGYRLVAGDTCTGGQQWHRVEMSCPGWFSGSGFGKVVFAILLVALVATAAFSCLKKTDAGEDLLDWFKSKLGGGRNDYWKIDAKGMQPDTPDDEFGMEEGDDHSATLLQERKPAAADSGTKPKPLPKGKAARPSDVAALPGPDSMDD